MRTLWRCFPWNPDAAEGAAFSPSHIVPGQTVGRFDLHDRPPVRYLADTPEHAIGEALSPFRGTRFVPAYLRQQGYPLALVDVALASALVDRIPDLTDPEVLSMLRLRPDDLAHHDRKLTQAIARGVHDAGIPSLGVPPRSYAGLRWWSALTGAWHTTVVFTDRIHRGEIQFGRPHQLDPRDTPVIRALSVLGIRSR